MNSERETPLSFSVLNNGKMIFFSRVLLFKAVKRCTFILLWLGLWQNSEQKMLFFLPRHLVVELVDKLLS